MRKYMINVAKRYTILNKYSHFFRIEMGGSNREDIEEVAREVKERFPFPEFKVEIYEGPEQYYTQISI